MKVINYIDNDKIVNDCLLVLIVFISIFINSLLIYIMKNNKLLGQSFVNSLVLYILNFNESRLLVCFTSLAELEK